MSGRWPKTIGGNNRLARKRRGYGGKRSSSKVKRK